MTYVAEERKGPGHVKPLATGDLPEERVGSGTDDMWVSVRGQDPKDNILTGRSLTRNRGGEADEEHFCGKYT